MASFPWSTPQRHRSSFNSCTLTLSLSSIPSTAWKCGSFQTPCSWVLCPRLLAFGYLCKTLSRHSSSTALHIAAEPHTESSGVRKLNSRVVPDEECAYPSQVAGAVLSQSMDVEEAFALIEAASNARDSSLYNACVRCPVGLLVLFEIPFWCCLCGRMLLTCCMSP